MDSNIKKFFNGRLELERRKNAELEKQRSVLKSKLDEIEKYCGPYRKYIWASTIIGIVKGLDVRDKR